MNDEWEFYVFGGYSDKEVIGGIFSRAAAVIGILLGGMAEDSVIYSYQISGGQWSYVLERPITLVILMLLLLSLFGSKLLGLLTRRASS